ncbi:MAG: indole-3-glycerol phosphate synthase TrpC [Gammaproteobacteria bacterium]
MLDEIIKNKFKEIDRLKSSFVISDFDSISSDRSFYNNLLTRQNSNKNSIIAEIKRRSPSKGILCENLDVSKKAKEYEKGGATCISVLTERDYFNGSNDDLEIVRNSVEVPVLRKDFILDPIQVYESKAINADCILLIVSALKKKLFIELCTLASSLHLDVLVEVHDIYELDFALSQNIKILGINNRNLKNFKVDLNTSIELAKHIKSEDVVIISESGISHKDDVLNLNNAGIFTFLIGEHLIKSSDTEKSIQELINVG